jgi:hypothetical protein
VASLKEKIGERTSVLESGKYFVKKTQAQTKKENVHEFCHIIVL